VLDDLDVRGVDVRVRCYKVLAEDGGELLGCLARMYVVCFCVSVATTTELSAFV
jgi:hypothetical protein